MILKKFQDFAVKQQKACSQLEEHTDRPGQDHRPEAQESFRFSSWRIAIISVTKYAELSCSVGLSFSPH